MCNARSFKIKRSEFTALPLNANEFPFLFLNSLLDLLNNCVAKARKELSGSSQIQMEVRKNTKDKRK